jgi:hypothetical protein
MEQRLLTWRIRRSFLKWAHARYAISFHFALGKWAIYTVILWAANVLFYIRVDVEHINSSANIRRPLSGSRAYPCKQEVMIFHFFFDVGTKPPNTARYDASHDDEKKGCITAGEGTKDVKQDGYKNTGKETD